MRYLQIIRLIIYSQVYILDKKTNNYNQVGLRCILGFIFLIEKYKAVTGQGFTYYIFEKKIDTNFSYS